MFPRAFLIKMPQISHGMSNDTIFGPFTVELWISTMITTMLFIAVLMLLDRLLFHTKFWSSLNFYTWETFRLLLPQAGFENSHFFFRRCFKIHVILLHPLIPNIS